MRQSDGFEMICPDLTEVLLVKIVRLTSVSLRVTPPPSKSKECAAAKRYIDENYNEAISLDKAGPRLHTSISTTCPTPLRKNMARTPIDYMLKRRITEAKALLSSTDYRPDTDC